MPLEHQCKNCGTPIRSVGFCSWHCKREWKENMEAKDLDFMNDERHRKEMEK